jgi:hypothetical protein
MTIDQVFGYLEMLIAESAQSGNRETLRRAQTTAGLLMDAANHNNDRETAARLRVLASKAANYIEEIENR